jgi:hypothetical protein
VGAAGFPEGAGDDEGAFVADFAADFGAGLGSDFGSDFADGFSAGAVSTAIAGRDFDLSSLGLREGMSVSAEREAQKIEYIRARGGGMNRDVVEKLCIRLREIALAVR